MMLEFKVGLDEPEELVEHKTQYCDLRDVPDPMYLGIGVRVYNYDTVTLYMQITGSGGGWTIGSTNLGSLGSGSNFFKQIYRFAQKAKHIGEIWDAVTVTLNAYTDSGYSNLKWSLNRGVPIFFFDSTDPCWTTDELDDFDDGTLQGWSCYPSIPCGYLGYCRVWAHYRSAPYSIQKYCDHTSAAGSDNAGFYKTFTIPDKDEIYMIADVYITFGASAARGFYLEHGNTNPPNYASNGIELNTVTDSTPLSTWVRLVAPLPRGVTEELRVGYRGNYGAYSAVRFYMDDFKIISRDN